MAHLVNHILAYHLRVPQPDATIPTACHMLSLIALPHLLPFSGFKIVEGGDPKKKKTNQPQIYLPHLISHQPSLSYHHPAASLIRSSLVSPAARGLRSALLGQQSGELGACIFGELEQEGSDGLDVGVCYAHLGSMGVRYWLLVRVDHPGGAGWDSAFGTGGLDVELQPGETFDLAGVAAVDPV